MRIKQQPLNLLLGVTGLMLGCLPLAAPSFAEDNRPAQGQRGFWCDTSNSSMPVTMYQNAAGGTEKWIEWKSKTYSDVGFEPKTRCQQVSQQFETQRRAGRLKYLTHAQKNGLNVICPAKSEGVCDGILFSLNPGQDPVKVLSQLLALREGIKDAPPIQM